MPDPTAPVTGDLRALLTETLTALGETRPGAVDALVARLASWLPLGDLPVRMRVAIHDAVCDHASRNGTACADCRIAAALSVRWPAGVQAHAEASEAKRREDFAVAEHQVTKERLAETRRVIAAQPKPASVEELREHIEEILGTSDEAAVEAFLCFASGEIARIAGGEMVARWQAEDALKAAEAQVAALRQKLADSERVRTKLNQTIAAAPDARDAANLAHARAQRDDFASQVAALQRQLAELRAGIAAAVAKIREWHTPGSALFDPGHASEVERTLRAYVGEHVIAAMEGRTADPEEIRRLAQATTEEKTDG